MSTAIVWFRRDLRLTDNPALQAALDRHQEIVPVFLFDPDAEGSWRPGNASLSWLHHSLHQLSVDLARRGNRLVIRRGSTHETLGALLRETGAAAVYWNRLYDPALMDRDRRLKAALRETGVVVQSFQGSLWAEPWTLTNGAGQAYKVFTPFWRTLSARLTAANIASAPATIPAPPVKVNSQHLDELGLAPTLGWDRGFYELWTPGEAGAHAQLRRFLDNGLADYGRLRDFPAAEGVSLLSPHLHFGEVSPTQLLAAVHHAELDGAPAGAVEHFLRELGWREFAHHLLFHFPHTPQQALNPAFLPFPWRTPKDYADDLRAWQRGKTGIPIVDAGMRELWTTGWMHNRVRMIVASFLTKNLLIPWQEGARWFWDTLVDADLANNALGWQWCAGCGADAAPYFRIFNPVLQAQKFDPHGRYLRRWLPERADLPDTRIHLPRAAGSGDIEPIIDLGASRQRALAAYQALKSMRTTETLQRSPSMLPIR